jgi:hypothetical protein
MLPGVIIKAHGVSIVGFLFAASIFSGYREFL